MLYRKGDGFMKEKKFFRVVWMAFVTMLLAVGIFFCGNGRIEAKQKFFTITKHSKPYAGMYLKSKVYNRYTRDYLLIKSYLVALSKRGGGKLRIKRGRYNISNALAIPSNTTIILENGVRLKKTSKSGVKSMPPGHILFECVRDSRLKRKRILRRYGGEKNISIVAQGDVRVYLQNCNGGQGVRLPHCQNISISNIKFKNLRDGHFIEVVGSKNVNITGCTFERNKGGKRCAINIDTPDKLTGGFGGEYSKFDKTPVRNIVIRDCSFLNNYRAIDTHKFSPGKYHKNIIIERCNFSGNILSPVKMLNWRNVTIKSCNFNDVRGYKYGDNKSEKFGIYVAGGCANFDIQDNCFNGVFVPFFAKGGQLQKYGGKMIQSNNDISNKSINMMKNNIIGSGVMKNYFIISKPGVTYISSKEKNYNKYYFNI